MPPIAATDFGALAILAERWVRRVDRVPALDLTNQQRRENPAAAAAFAVKTFRNQPFLEACRCCGRWTGSWCEGYYAVAVDAPDWAFSALCTECDGDRITCPRCRLHGITWEAGNDAYKIYFESEEAAQVQVQEAADGLWAATEIRVPGQGTQSSASAQAPSTADTANSPARPRSRGC